MSAALRPALFKALCDPVRVSIVARLATRQDPVAVSDLVACCGIDFSGVSRHLKLLRQAGVVSATREGRSVRYSLNSDALCQVLRASADALEQCSEQAG